jgi:alanine racemase
MTSSSWVEINSFALMHNVRWLRQSIGDMPIWAVVKANAYGHDLAIATEALWRAGVDGWVVTDSNDAHWLSQQRYKLPILILFPLEDSLLPTAFEHGWHLSVTSEDYLARIEHMAGLYRKNAKIHLEIETGMHRTGIPAVNAELAIARYAVPASPIKIIGLFTHLYDVDTAAISHNQLTIMAELQFSLQRKALPIPSTHVLASDGLALYGGDYAFDAVRLGKALYGFCRHFPETSESLTWKTRIITTSELKPGDTVGYSGMYRAQKNIRIATLPVGYGDGLDRRLSNQGFVLVGGKQCPVLGLISMNHTMIDISGVFKVEVGDEVVLLGSQKGAEIKLADITNWAGILDYEFITGINLSIKRSPAKESRFSQEG